MLVYPVLVVALGALWPLDWRHTRLDSLSPVTGHYHGTTWAMAETVTQGDDPEEVVVVEANSSDEVAKNKESPKGWKQKLKEWAIEYAILDENGHFEWNAYVVLFGLMFIMATMTLGVPAAIVIIIIYFIGRLFFKLFNPKSWSGWCGGATKNMNGTKLD
ncbi:putative integral membrane protein [Babesia bovis T2Bo]|uniref:putative integral membrane protein n=1 Tax=Babesia bovis T2Bo TaxID=484906 RepID=UPI001C367586|nr:putative integral membrane protein [Babesia bovis T2Bo]KAG6440082.1 putative integral membrane protein [Babesia bovis T2Bo]